ncbi:DUF6525 family protein [Shimia sp.]|uniref:DUF6525 family protein n=1 Tax=Shimia sp. TaxID=1954381 RepID=UPI00329A464F
MVPCAGGRVLGMAEKKDALARRGSNARTSLRRKKRTGDPMAAYNRLPADLRAWLAYAALPWSLRSALRVWRSAIKANGDDTTAARLYLSQLEQKRLDQEAGKIWGAD